MSGFLIRFINRVALVNVVSVRRAVAAFLGAMAFADVDRNGEMNVKELLSATRDMLVLSVYQDDMDDGQLHDMLDEILGTKVHK